MSGNSFMIVGLFVSVELIKFSRFCYRPELYLTKLSRCHTNMWMIWPQFTVNGQKWRSDMSK